MSNSKKISAGVEVIVTPLEANGTKTWQFSCHDKDTELFERQYPLTDGMTYNSYVIEDEKIAVMDTVDHSVETVWMERLLDFLAGRKPDYLIIHHLEPDHSSSLGDFISRFPDCEIICSVKAGTMLPAFLGGTPACKVTPMKDGDELSLGKRILRFFTAPMVHWPEVMMSYDTTGGFLFCADAFGTFGCGIAEKPLAADKHNEWLPEARRYYYNICGKFGVSVAGALRKVAPLEVSWLCPLHGPAVRESMTKAIEAYQRWSRWESDNNDTVFIAAASLHGFTLAAARELKDMLEAKGLKVVFSDLATAELSECVSQAFAAPVTVFASSTYDAGIMPSMSALLSRLKSKAWQNRKVGIIENGSWAPAAAKQITNELNENFKGIEILEPIVSIRTKLDSTSHDALVALADSIASVF